MNSKIVLYKKCFEDDINMEVNNMNWYKNWELYTFLKQKVTDDTVDRVVIYCINKETVNSVYSKITTQKYGFEGRAVKYDGTADVPVVITTFEDGVKSKFTNIKYVIHYNMPYDIESYNMQLDSVTGDSDTIESILYYSNQDAAMCKATIEENGEDVDGKIERLKHMMLYTKNIFDNLPFDGNKSLETAQMLAKYIEDYIAVNVKAEPVKATKKQVKKNATNKKDKAKSDKEIETLLINISKDAMRIREGKYDFAVCKKNAPDLKLDYFDMMVADAVYTIEKANKTSVFVKNVLQLLSGDNTVTVKKSSKQDENIERIGDRIEKSIEKMMNTYILIDGEWVVFMPLIKSEGGRGYKYKEILPLYQKAQQDAKEIYEIPLNKLLIKEELAGKTKKMPDSYENLMLRYFIAGSVDMGVNSLYGVNTNDCTDILLSDTKDFRGILDVIDVEQLSDKYTQERKRLGILDKINVILNNYKQNGYCKDGYIYKIENDVKVPITTNTDYKAAIGIQIKY